MNTIFIIQVRYETGNEVFDEATTTPAVTKKRVGVTNSLIPPKRALDAFDKLSSTNQR